MLRMQIDGVYINSFLEVNLERVFARLSSDGIELTPHDRQPM